GGIVLGPAGCTCEPHGRGKDGKGRHSERTISLHRRPLLQIRNAGVVITRRGATQLTKTSRRSVEGLGGFRALLYAPQLGRRCARRVPRGARRRPPGGIRGAPGSRRSRE